MKKSKRKALSHSVLADRDKGTKKAKQPFFCSSISKLEVLIYEEY